VGLTVDLAIARRACTASLTALLDAVDGLSELELLDASRCRGWTRLDVVVHLVGGCSELMQGLLTPVDDAPTVDSASYWTAFADQYHDDDPVPALMFQRRRTAAYDRPATAREHLREVGAAALRGIQVMPDRHRRWDRQVFTAGDFLTVWVVEHVVHHLDLLGAEPPPPSQGLALARRTVEALLGEPLPGSWSDETATLVGTGRVPPPDDAAHLASRLPVLG
jgi:uncharacterized protein (TIGR03083 family)